MDVASVGPITTLLQTAAASVGSGILLGGFAIGAIGVAAKWPRKALDELVLRTGYLGGLAAAIAIAFDLLLRYAGLR